MSAGASRIARAEPAAVAREAAVLRALLEGSFRPFESRPVDLSDASEHVRAFWSEVGWSPLFASNLEPPETAHAHARVPKLMAEYAREKHFRLRMGDLPERFRLVHVDSQGLGFELTDESSGTDPLVLGVSEQKGTISQGPASYLARCAAELTEMSFRRQYKTGFEADPSVELGGRRLIPLLAPDVRELAQGVWLTSSTPTRDKARVRHSVRHVTTEALLAWLRTLPAGTSAVMDLFWAGDTVNVDVGTRERLEGVYLLRDAVREFPYEVGSLEAVPVICWRETEGTAKLLVSPRESRRFRPAAKAVEAPNLVSVDTRGVGLKDPPAPVKRSEAALRKAIGTLAEMIDPVPLHHDTRRLVTLEPGAPRDLRLFWERIGWSKLLGRVCFPPERELGESELRAVLARWMQEARTRDRFQLPDGADPATLPVFPARRRLFARYLPKSEYDYLVPNSSYLVVADESGGEDDPPLFETRPGHPERVYLPKGYVAHLASLLFAEAFESGGPAAPPGEHAEKPLEPLVDDVWLVAPGVLCCRSLAGGPNGSGFGACFRSLHAYYEYAKTLPDSVIAQFKPAGADSVRHDVLAKAKLTPEKAATLGLRVSPIHSGRTSGPTQQVALGMIEGAPVWLSWRASNGRVLERSLVTTASDAERVKRALGV